MYDFGRHQYAWTGRAIAFLVAGVLEIAALAFISSWILAWLSVSMQTAVAYLVNSGITACVIVTGILLGVLSNAYGFKSCMDKQEPPVVLE